MKERQLIIVPNRVPTSSHVINNEIKGYYLAFNLIFFLQKEFPRHHLTKLNLANPHLQPCIYLDTQDGEKVENIFETILDERDHLRRNKEYMVALKILELILFCDRLFSKENPLPKVPQPPLLLQYIDLIQDQYREHHSTSYYAAKLHIHPNALNALSKRHLGESAKSVIDGKLIIESKYLLQHTTLSVKEIAYDLGFNSPSQFFRFFKRYTGHSPAQGRLHTFE
jgi:AraC-like DNA-binding protein